MSENEEDKKIISFTRSKEKYEGTPMAELIEWMEQVPEIPDKTLHKLRARYLQSQIHVDGKEPKNEHPGADPRDFRVFGQNPGKDK